MKRKAFGMINLLFFIIMIGGVLSLGVNIAKKSELHTKNSDRRLQAENFLNNCIELSILAIESYERNSTNNCVKKLTFNSEDNKFKVDVNISSYFLYEGTNDISYCNGNNLNLSFPIKTEESHGTAILNMTLTNTDNSKKIRIFKRTVQKL